MADEDVTIDIPADDTAVVVETADKDEKVVKVEQKDEGIEELKGQLKTFQERAEEEKRARERSDALARQRTEEAASARAEADKATTRASDNEESAIDNAINAAKAEADAAERDYQAAFEAGDSKKLAETQRKISRAESRLVQFEGAKADLEARKLEPKPERQERKVETQGDPFESAIARASPRAQSWLREHKEYVTDPKLNKKAAAAHNMAEAEGYIPDSDAYFDFCEKFLGLKEEPKQEQVKPTRTRTAMPAAPVSRDGSNPTNGNYANQVVLTPGEQRAAMETIIWNYTDPKIGAVKGEPIGLKEYARRKSAMTKEGRYDRSMTDQ